jgi:predicted nucleic acid-binding protein
LGVNTTKLEAGLSPGTTLVIDTCVLIAYLEGGQPISDVARLLVDDWVYSGRNRGFFSSVSAMELLVGPLKSQRPIDEYLNFLQRFPNLECVPVDTRVAIQAATLRAAHRLKPPDALIVGTALAIDAAAIVTNDDDWPKTLPKPIVRLSDYL